MSNIVSSLTELQLYRSVIQARNLLSYQSCKVVSATIADYYLQSGNEDYLTYAQRILNCAPYIVLVPEVEQLPQGLKIIPHVMESKWCRVRHCPLCIKVKSAKWAAKFYKVMPRIQSDYPKHQYLFLTLTIRKRPLIELRQTTRELNAAWKKFRSRKDFPAVGFIRSFEVTAGRGLMPDGQQGAHAHFHVLMMVDENYFRNQYLSAERWGELWQEAMRLDYRPSIRIQKVRANLRRGTDGLSSAIAEVAKYCIKPAELATSPEFLLGCTEALHRVRSVTVGGEFKNYIKQNELDRIDDMQKLGDEYQMEGPRFRVEWDDSVQRYRCDNQALGAMMVGSVNSEDPMDFEGFEFD